MKIRMIILSLVVFISIVALCSCIQFVICPEEAKFVEGKTVFCSCGDMKHEYYWNNEIKQQREKNGN